MSHLILRRINGRWRMFNKHTKKTEGPAFAHKEEAAIATHKKDIEEDKKFDKEVDKEHEEHPEFSKKSAKKIAIDHERMEAEGKKPADEKGRGSNPFQVSNEEALRRYAQAMKKLRKHPREDEFDEGGHPIGEKIAEREEREYDEWKEDHMGKGGFNYPHQRTAFYKRRNWLKKHQEEIKAKTTPFHRAENASVTTGQYQALQKKHQDEEESEDEKRARRVAHHFGDVEDPDAEYDRKKDEEGRGSGKILNPYDKEALMGRGGEYTAYGQCEYCGKEYKMHSSKMSGGYAKCPHCHKQSANWTDSLAENKRMKEEYRQASKNEGRGSDMSNMTYNKISSGKGAGMKKPEPKYEWEIHGNYGSRWEPVTTETSIEDARRALRDYDENEREYPHKIVKVRIQSGKGGDMDKLGPSRTKTGAGADKHQKRLEQLRKTIRKGNMSYGELAELESLKKHIKPGDVELAQWAGIPEEEFNKGRGSGHMMKGQCWAMGSGGDHSFKDGRCVHCGVRGEGGYGGDRPPMHLDLKKGALHRELGVSQDKTIPAKKLAIHEGDSALERKRKQFAINAKKWHHGGGEGRGSNTQSYNHRVVYAGSSADTYLKNKGYQMVHKENGMAMYKIPTSDPNSNGPALFVLKRKGRV